MAGNHKIRRLVLEVEADDPGLARERQRDLQRLARRELPALIESVCDSLGLTNRHYRVDSLRLDLGTIAAQAFAEDFLERLRTALEAALVAEVARQDLAEATSPAPAGSILEELDVFARTGTLPWWSEHPSMASLDQAVAAAIQRSPAGVRHLVCTLGSQAYLDRLAFNLSSDTLGQLLRVLGWPHSLGAPNGVVEVVGRMLKTRCGRARGAYPWPVAVWRAFLRTLAVNALPGEVSPEHMLSGACDVLVELTGVDETVAWPMFSSLATSGALTPPVAIQVVLDGFATGASEVAELNGERLVEIWQWLQRYQPEHDILPLLHRKIVEANISELPAGEQADRPKTVSGSSKPADATSMSPTQIRETPALPDYVRQVMAAAGLQDNSPEVVGRRTSKKLTQQSRQPQVPRADSGRKSIDSVHKHVMPEEQVIPKTEEGVGATTNSPARTHEHGIGPVAGKRRVTSTTDVNDLPAREQAKAEHQNHWRDSDEHAARARILGEPDGQGVHQSDATAVAANNRSDRRSQRVDADAVAEQRDRDKVSELDSAQPQDQALTAMSAELAQRGDNPPAVELAQHGDGRHNLTPQASVELASQVAAKAHDAVALARHEKRAGQEQIATGHEFAELTGQLSDASTELTGHEHDTDRAETGHEDNPARGAPTESTVREHDTASAETGHGHNPARGAPTEPREHNAARRAPAELSDNAAADELTGQEHNAAYLDRLGGQERNRRGDANGAAEVTGREHEGTSETLSNASPVAQTGIEPTPRTDVAPTRSAQRREHIAAMVGAGKDPLKPIPAPNTEPSASFEGADKGLDATTVRVREELSSSNRMQVQQIPPSISVKSSQTDAGEARGHVEKQNAMPGQPPESSPREAPPAGAQTGAEQGGQLPNQPEATAVSGSSVGHKSPGTGDSQPTAWAYFERALVQLDWQTRAAWSRLLSPVRGQLQFTPERRGPLIRELVGRGLTSGILQLHHLEKMCVQLSSRGEGPPSPVLLRVLRQAGLRARQPAAEPEPERPGRVIPNDELLVHDAGLVLLWPFLGHFFRYLGVVEGREFVDVQAQHRAVGVLSAVATGLREPPEYHTMLAKLLCGLEVDDVLMFGPPVSDHEYEECQNLLTAVLDRAQVLGDIGSDGLRHTFLLRRGILSVRDGGYLLRVESLAHDLLLSHLEWSFEIFKLPWMAAALAVEWV